MWRGGREWSEKPYNARRLRQEVPHQKLSQCHLQPRTKSTLPSQHMHGRVAKLYWHQCSLERQLTSVCGCVDSVKGRSSSTTAHTSPASIVLKISLWTEMTAVSVEWCALQADWRDGKSCWDSMWTLSLAAATRSTTFDKKLKLDIGRNEFTSSGSSVGFFNARIIKVKLSYLSIYLLIYWLIIRSSSTFIWTFCFGLDDDRTYCWAFFYRPSHEGRYILPRDLSVYLSVCPSRH